MIDLSAKSKAKLYSIKMEDGTILKLRQPSQRLLNKLVEMASYADEGAEAETIAYIYDIIREIFNRNTDRRQFSQEDIEDLFSIDLAMEVIEDYLAYTLGEIKK